MKIIKKHPFFLFMLPLFFILHGALENRGAIPFVDGVLLLGIYILVTVIITLLCFLYFKSLHKAAVAAVWLMGVHLFFGAFHDFVKKYFGNSFLSQYSFLLSFLLVVTVLFFVLLRRAGKTLPLVYFLNCAFLIFIVIDLLGFAFRAENNHPQQLYTNSNTVKMLEEFNIGDTCSKPDIYITILDEYAGKEQLTQGFDYDNSPFFEQLHQRGFQVAANSKCNYNATIYSVSSLFSGQYLDSSSITDKVTGFKYATRIINKNLVLEFLKHNGYHFYNQSIFTVAGQQSPNTKGFVPAKMRIITDATLLNRLKKDVLINIATRFKINWYLKNEKYTAAVNNEKALSETVNISAQTAASPRVVYTHLFMPHYPYYRDSSGNALSFELLNTQKEDDTKAYLDYLKYTNTRITGYLDALLKNTKGQAVIILLSDHGNRYLAGEKSKLLYSNLVSVYVPAGINYQLPDTITNVNLFPTLLNSLFNMNLTVSENKYYKFPY